MRIAGRCHCGNLSYLFETDLALDTLPARACDCSFCRAHGARCASDPSGSVRIAVARPERLSRYRFGLRTAEFLLCSDCGVYLAAVLEAGGEQRATVNLAASELHERPATSVSYAGESADRRRARRWARWTPVTELRLGQ